MQHTLGLRITECSLNLGTDCTSYLSVPRANDIATMEEIDAYIKKIKAKQKAINKVEPKRITLKNLKKSYDKYKINVEMATEQAKKNQAFFIKAVAFARRFEGQHYSILNDNQEFEDFRKLANEEAKIFRSGNPYSLCMKFMRTLESMNEELTFISDRTIKMTMYA